MSRGKKIILGIISFIPLLLFVIYLVTMVSFIIGFIREVDLHGEPQDFPFGEAAGLVTLVVSSVLLGLLALGVMVYFIVHAINNPLINRDERIIWVLVFVFVGMVTFPVYWYLRIWRSPDTHPSTG